MKYVLVFHYLLRQTLVEAIYHDVIHDHVISRQGETHLAVASLQAYTTWCGPEEFGWRS